MKWLIITLCLAISLACASFGVGWSQDFQIGKATCKDDLKYVITVFATTQQNK